MSSKSLEGSDNMPNDISDLADLARKVEATELPQSSIGIEILPVSNDQFQARWSLSKDTLEKGRDIASQSSEETYLVLRAFLLPAEADNGELSSVWHDFQIDGIDNSGYFNLPYAAEKINASLGLINKDGRFSPLLRGNSVTLPAAPAAPTAAAKSKGATPGSKEVNGGSIPLKRAAIIENLSETEVCARLATIDGLPEEFKIPARQHLAQAEASGFMKPEAATVKKAETNSKALKALPETPSLDEASMLETVRQKIAIQPEPEIEDSVERPPIHSTETDEENLTKNGASELLASQWEDIWSDKAPIEIRAEFVLTGKIAPGMQILLGNEIIVPAPGGFFTWKRGLESFDQAWPLLQAALSTPVVSAAPSLEFFRNRTPSKRLLELHGSIEIAGQVTDPDYIKLLPAELAPDSSGKFKLYRMLPDGAVILPGLSLIAAK